MPTPHGCCIFALFEQRESIIFQFLILNFQFNHGYTLQESTEK